jgi:hypothetical protein
VISISIDEGAAARPAILKFLKKAKPSFAVVHDPTLAAEKAFDLGGMIPMNVALDRSGKIIAVASDDKKELEQAMAALAKSAPARRANAR